MRDSSWHLFSRIVMNSDIINPHKNQLLKWERTGKLPSNKRHQDYYSLTSTYVIWEMTRWPTEMDDVWLWMSSMHQVKDSATHRSPFPPDFHQGGSSTSVHITQEHDGPQALDRQWCTRIKSEDFLSEQSFNIIYQNIRLNHTRPLVKALRNEKC